MKKTLIVSFILLMIAMVVFYFGWTQFRMDPDMYGVVHSRTGGYHERPIESGRFSWTPAALIPKNVTIYQLPATPKTVHTTYQGQLPSGTLYGMTLMGTPDFSVSFALEVTYRIRQSAVVTLVRDRGLRIEDLGGWYMAVERDITEKLADTLLREAATTSHEMSSNTYELFIQRIVDQFQIGWNGSSSSVEIIAMDINALVLPDLELYQTGRSAYRGLTAVKTASLEQELLGNATIRAEYETRLDLLERYGELLSRYPALIEYLKVDPDLGAGF